MSGGAPAADVANNLFLITGNGVFDGTGSFGDSYLRLTTPALSVADYFALKDLFEFLQVDDEAGCGID